MAKVISISLFKGGTGKTTTAVNLASGLAKKGKRVLLVDLDQQASATRHVGIDPDKIEKNLYHVFMRQTPASLVVRKTAFNFDILPSHPLMAAIEEALEAKKDEGLLKELIAPLFPDYDYLVIDTPPGKQLLGFNALCSADWVLAPVSAERMAIDGLTDLINHVTDIMWGNYEELANQEIRILFTMYKANTSHSPGVVKQAKKIWRKNVLRTVIPETIEFPRSFEKKKPLIDYNPKHKGSLAYLQLADWVIKNI